MRLELDLIPSSFSVPENAPPQNNFSAEAKDLLSEGIKHAQAGNRSRARACLLHASELEPRSESTWLWLASISEYPEELLVFLTNVLEINPENGRANEWMSATKSLLSKTLVQRGIDAAEDAKTDYASQCFNQALEYDQNNVMAWLWMASLCDSNEGKINYFERVLSLEPENTTAADGLSQARASISGQQLAEARAAAVAGRSAEANEFLDAIIAENPDSEDAWILRAHLADGFERKILAFERVLMINPANPAARFGLDSIRSIIETVATPQGSFDQAEPPASGNRDENGASTSVAPEQQEVPAAAKDIISEDGENSFATLAEEARYDQFAVSEISDEQPAYNPFEINSADTSIAEDVIPAIDESESASEQPPSFYDDRDTAAVTRSGSELEEHSSPFTETERSLQIDSADENAQTKSVEAVSGFPTDPQAAPKQNNHSDAWESTDHHPTAAAEHLAADEHLHDTILAPFDSLADESVEYGAIDEIAAPDEQLEAASTNDTLLPNTSLETGDYLQPAGPERMRDRRVSLADDFEKCPFCACENEKQDPICKMCMAVLTLSDIDLLVAHGDADKLIVRNAVEQMEAERNTHDFTKDEIINLALGHLNLRNFREGFSCLHQASQLNSDDVVLSGQVNALHIRLEEFAVRAEAADGSQKGKSILVVDDSPTVRKLIAGKLEKAGHEVFCAGDGVEALERIKKLVPDLILLDITMPRMDGYQVCKAIRSNASTQNVPVVMISGKDGFFDKVRGRMAGTTGYITKPFGPETLMKTVETYLSPVVVSEQIN